MCQEPPILEVHIWRMLMVPDSILGGWGHSWYHGLLRCFIFYLCANFQLCSKIISVSRTPCPRSHTWSMLKVPDWIIGGWGHSLYYQSSWYVILDLCCKFQLSSMNRNVSRTPRPWSNTWRILMVPDWRFWGWGYPWHFWSSWDTTRNLQFWKFGEDLTSLAEILRFVDPI